MADKPPDNVRRVAKADAQSDRRAGFLVAEYESYAGPLPHPRYLREYEETCPGSARDIIDAFVRQGQHRQHLERTVVEGNNYRATRSMYIAAVMFSC